MNKAETDKLFSGNHLTDEAFALYADAMVQNQEEQLPAMIREHVAHCFQCKKEIFATYEISNASPILDRQELITTNPKPYVKNFKIGKVFKIAASFLLVGGLGALLYYFAFNKQATQQTVATIEKPKMDRSKKSVVQNITIAQEAIAPKKSQAVENIGESEMLEGLISSQYRNSDIETLSPKLNQPLKVNKPIVFLFSSELSEPCRIIIFNHKGKKIVETEKFSSSSYTFHKKLQPGLYYWKLEKDDDLINVSKFIVTE